MLRDELEDPSFEPRYRQRRWQWLAEDLCPRILCPLDLRPRSF
jgi:hypothetical protein